MVETLVVLVGLSGVSYFSSYYKIRSITFRNASVLVIPNFSQYANNLRAVCSSSLALTSIFLGFLEGGLPFCGLILSPLFCATIKLYLLSHKKSRDFSKFFHPTYGIKIRHSISPCLSLLWGGQEHTLTGLLPSIQLTSYISFPKNGYKNTTHSEE